MKIKAIYEGQTKLNLCVPTWLVLNYVTATFAPIFINKKGVIKVGVTACWKFVRVFYKTRKRYGGSFDLVDVESADGTLVKITV